MDVGIITGPFVNVLLDELGGGSVLDFAPGSVHDSWSKDTNAGIKDHSGVDTHSGVLGKQEQQEAAAAPVALSAACRTCLGCSNDGGRQAGHGSVVGEQGIRNGAHGQHKAPACRGVCAQPLPGRNHQELQGAQ